MNKVEVLKIQCNGDPEKACGLLGIPDRMLTDEAEILALPIS